MKSYKICTQRKHSSQDNNESGTALRISSNHEFTNTVKPLETMRNATVSSTTLDAIRDSYEAVTYKQLLPPVEYFVFSGGGVKGFALIGALECLYRVYRTRGINLSHNLKGAAGSSIGALIALLTVCGHQPAEMTLNITKYNVFDLMKRSDFTLLLDSFGLISSEFLRCWVEDILLQRFGDAQCTFSQLRYRTGKDLRIVVSDLTTKNRIVFSSKSHPNVPVAIPVAASMSVPLLFPAVPWVDDQKRTHMLIDGSVFDNFPIDQFDLERSLAFSITSGEFHANHIGEYIVHLFDAVSGNMEKDRYRRLDDHAKMNILAFNLEAVHSLNFALSEDRIRDLIEIGEAQMLRYICLRSVLWLLPGLLCLAATEHAVVRTTALSTF